MSAFGQRSTLGLPGGGALAGGDELHRHGGILVALLQTLLGLTGG